MAWGSRPTRLATGSKTRIDLAFPVGDAAFAEIVRRQLNANLVPRNNPNEVFAHPSSHVRHHFIARFQLDSETRIRERLGNSTLDLKGLFFFCQLSTLFKEAYQAVAPAPVRRSSPGPIYVAKAGVVHFLRHSDLAIDRS